MKVSISKFAVHGSKTPLVALEVDLGGVTLGDYDSEADSFIFTLDEEEAAKLTAGLIKHFNLSLKEQQNVN